MLVELWTVNLQNEKETNVPQQATSQALDRENSLRTVEPRYFELSGETKVVGNNGSSK